MSANGRVVVFTTAAALVPEDTNRLPDLYALDLRSGTTVLVARTARGRAADQPTFFGSISRDGRYVAFQTAATNLADGDTNGREDVYVSDLETGRVGRVSLMPAGVRPLTAALEPRISLDASTVLFATLDPRDHVLLWTRDLRSGTTRRVPTGVDAHHVITSWTLSGDGRYVALATDQPLVPDDTNGRFDAYRIDRRSSEVVLVSRSTTGRVTTAGSEVVDLSADGSAAVFTSEAPDLVAGDTNGFVDVFRRDLVRGTTTRISVSSTGVQGDGESGFTRDVAISADGRHAVFVSFATTLVPGDTNRRPDVFASDLAGDR